MNIKTFISEYNSLSVTRRQAGLQALFDIILSDPFAHENLILDILDLTLLAEENGYFGLGLDI